MLCRFFQIEEYNTIRYIRWLASKRTAIFSLKAIFSFAVGMILTIIASEQLAYSLLGLVWIVASGVAVWPPRDQEVKKKFQRTTRAIFTLTAAYVTILVGFITAVFLVTSSNAVNSDSLRLSSLGLAGLGFLLVCPLSLVAGNILLKPAEILSKWLIVRKARQIIANSRTVNIGITGSYGKTSTKTYLTHILNGRYRVLSTPKSYNTLMGVCSVINKILANDHSLEYFIIEMGAYVRGEIKRLCDLTQPQISLVVEVGPQHLERFGSLENIASAKYEIIKALPPNGVGVFNWDNSYIRAMYHRGYPSTRIAVSRSIDPTNVPNDGPRFIASSVSESLEGLRFDVTDTLTGESLSFSTKLIGEHNVTNILMATAVAVHEGMTLKDVARRVQTLEPAENRLVRQITPEGITIINDAYSANPVGAVSALRVLGMHTAGKRLLITPGMVELGSQMVSENRRLGEIAAQYATHIILVGAERIQPIKAGLLSAGFSSENLVVTNTLSEAIDWYRQHLQQGDSVLFLNDLPDTYS
jgi:UDP-N-acetylmuramoyl-tripeptide--D-alanyl-D-alanine ligase